MMNKLSKIVVNGILLTLLLCSYKELPGQCYIPSADRTWSDAEYLIWKIQNSPVTTPLLLKTANDTVVTALGQSDASIVLGDSHVYNAWRSGGRFALGYWFNDQHTMGTELNYFFMPSCSHSKTISSSGSIDSKVLAAPFFDVLDGVETSTFVAFPGIYAGEATLKVSNHMQGAELNATASFPSDCALIVSLSSGFRYWNYNERLLFTTSSPFIDAPSDVFQTYDKFHTQNNFFGGQVGVGIDYTYDDFIVSLKGKLALGAMCERLHIDGELVTNDFTGYANPQKFVGGYFAEPTNIGHYNRTEFSVIPELNLNLGYQVFDAIRIEVGYSFLCVSDMLWAGKQIDRKINYTQSTVLDYTPTPELVGPANLKPMFKSDSLWAQGFNVSLHIEF